MLFLTLTSNNTNWCDHMMSPSDQLSSSIDSSLSHLQWVYQQAVLDPVCSVSPMLLPRQHLLLYKSSPHHCLLLLDVPCPDEKTLFLRFLTRLPSGRKSLRASLLALFLTLLACLPRGCRSHLASPRCSCHRRNFLTLLWCSFLLLRAWTVVCYHSSHSGLDALVAWFRFLSVVQVDALASSLLPPGATLLNKICVLLFITVLRSFSFLIPH